MATTDKKSVVDTKKKRRKLSDTDLGKLMRMVHEIIKRDGISFNEALEVIQKIILENKSRDHLKVIHRTHHIVRIKYIIDGDADAHFPTDPPNGLKIHLHQKHGKLNWHHDVISYDHDEPRSRTMNFKYGNEVLAKFEEKTLPNANAVAFYLKHPWLIPEEWKGQIIYFFGTIYIDSDGKLYAWCLKWHPDKNVWSATLTCYASTFFAPNMVVAIFPKN